MDIVLADVRPDDARQRVGGGDGEAAPQRHETDAGHVGVELARALPVREERLVEQRRGDDAVQLQALGIPRLRDGRGDEAERHGGHEIHEHGEDERDQHHHGVAASDPADPGQKAPVDRVPADFRQNAREDRLRDRFGDPAHPEGQRQQDGGAHDACERGPAARADVQHGERGGSCAGQAADQSGRDVADPLPHQLAVGIVTPAGQRVGHQQGEQAVDGADEGEYERRLQGAGDEVEGEPGSKLGGPDTVAPRTGASPNQSEAARLPMIRAASGAGRNRRILRGQPQLTASATAATATASGLTAATGGP